MKLHIAALLFICSVLAKGVSAQQAPVLFQTLPDEEQKKVLVGFINKQQLKEDTAFAWYGQTLQFFRPNKEAVATLAEKAYDVHIMLFLGTWCPDSHQLVPKYLAALEAAEFPDHHLTLIGVDREKRALANLHRPLNIINVPTIIVMQQGKELGRIVEFGDGERADKQLAAIMVTATSTGN